MCLFIPYQCAQTLLDKNKSDVVCGQPLWKGFAVSFSQELQHCFGYSRALLLALSKSCTELASIAPKGATVKVIRSFKWGLQDKKGVQNKNPQRVHMCIITHLWSKICKNGLARR